MSLELWLVAVIVCSVLFAVTALVWAAIAIDADTVPGFEPRSHKVASESRPPRETRRESLTGRPAGHPARPVGPGRGLHEPLDDGELRHEWEWNARLRALEGEA